MRYAKIADVPVNISPTLSFQLNPEFHLDFCHPKQAAVLGNFENPQIPVLVRFRIQESKITMSE